MTTRRFVLPALAVIAALAACSRVDPMAPGAQPTSVLPAPAQRATVPDFAGATAWLNTDHALASQELRGRVVVVDFWTSCCINCLQTLPVLAAVERRFADQPFVVVGVHSPKFDAETEQTRLRAVLAENAIEHPIAIDGSMAVWNAWHVNAWPTVYVLDAHGRVVWRGSGEPDLDRLTGVIAAALAEGEQEHALDHGKLAGLRPEHHDERPLASPGKVIGLADGGVAISDTAHHRVVITAADGSVRDVVGSGLAGALDGAYASASFRKPQGLAEAGDRIYVADTENHEVRVIDRTARTVSTIAGTGTLGAGMLGARPVPARTTALRSPWDLAVVGGTLYVALAGAHQIAAIDPGAATIRVFAGDGRERRRDGIGVDASFAQPSGLATDGTSLYVADSETSSIRAIDLATAAVRTLVGDDLFVFGDVDGHGAQVRLKHPIGIAWGQGALWIADTYNSKLKRLDPRTAAVTTVAGGAARDQLFEPSGLFVRGDVITVADTHHDRLAELSVRGEARSAWSPRGLAAPTSGVAVAAARDDDVASLESLDLGEVAVAPGRATVHVRWALPDGTAINEDAPFHVRWTTADGVMSPAPISATGKAVAQGFDIPVALAGASGKLVARLDVVLCDSKTHAVCNPLRRRLLLAARAGRERDVQVSVALPAAHR